VKRDEVDDEHITAPCGDLQGTKYVQNMRDETGKVTRNE
jgi:hypothetical protein